MKKLLIWGAVGLLTAALHDPLLYSMLDQPIPWFWDMLLATGGLICFYLHLKFRDEP
jgi:hypothetical protein